MEEVVEANEEKIGVVNYATNLYPFILVAVDETTISDDLSTVYHLIKRRSHLVTLYTRSTPRNKARRD